MDVKENPTNFFNGIIKPLMEGKIQFQWNFYQIVYQYRFISFDEL